MKVILVLYRREDFLHWIDNLPDTQTPSWLGLPNTAEKVMLTSQGGLDECHFMPCSDIVLRKISSSSKSSAIAICELFLPMLHAI